MSEQPLLNRPVIRDCRLFPGLVARWEYPLQRNDMIDALEGLSVGVRPSAARGRGTSDMVHHGKSAWVHLNIGRGGRVIFALCNGQDIACRRLYVAVCSTAGPS